MSKRRLDVIEQRRTKTHQENESREINQISTCEFGLHLSNRAIRQFGGRIGPVELFGDFRIGISFDDSWGLSAASPYCSKNISTSGVVCAAALGWMLRPLWPSSIRGVGEEMRRTVDLSGFSASVVNRKLEYNWREGRFDSFQTRSPGSLSTWRGLFRADFCYR